MTMMTRDALLGWACDHAEGEVARHSDNKRSLSSSLLRFRWNGSMTVAVGLYSGEEL